MARKIGEESKRKLFQAAEELFAAKGVHRTKISEIVAKAGLTQAAFYLYFKSKEDIFQQMLHEFEQQLVLFSNAEKKAADYYPKEVKGYVSATIADLFRFLCQNPNLTKIALRYNEDDHIRKKIVDHIASNMANNQKLGIVKKEVDAKFAAEALLAVIERLVERYLLPGEKNENELGEQVALIFLEGILNSKGG